MEIYSFTYTNFVDNGAPKTTHSSLKYLNLQAVWQTVKLMWKL